GPSSALPCTSFWLTNVPLLDSRSSTTSPSPALSTLAWRRETCPSSSTTSAAAGSRPRTSVPTTGIWRPLPGPSTISISKSIDAPRSSALDDSAAPTTAATAAAAACGRRGGTVGCRRRRRGRGRRRDGRGRERGHGRGMPRRGDRGGLHCHRHDGGSGDLVISASRARRRIGDTERGTGRKHAGEDGYRSPEPVLRGGGGPRLRQRSVRLKFPATMS